MDIKSALEEGRVVIGTRTVMKALKTGKAKSVLYASNCPKETVSRYR